MYHYVRPIKNTQYPKVKGLETDEFIRQLQYLKEKFRFMNVRDVLDSIYEGKRIPDQSVLLTFDDGLRDHYRYVFPILKKLNIQGLFFPPGKPIKEHVVLDVHKIHFILACCENTSSLVNEIFSLIEKNKRDYDLKEAKEYFNELAVPNRFDPKEIIFVKRLLQHSLPEELRTKFTDYLFKKYVMEDEKTFAKELYLSLEEIREMCESDMYFGSHTYSHYWLSHLTPNMLTKELEQSIYFHSKINSDKKSWILSYPYGSYDQNIITMITKAGFKAALTTEVGEAALSKETAFTLKRFDTHDFPQ